MPTRSLNITILSLTLLTAVGITEGMAQFPGIPPQPNMGDMGLTGSGSTPQSQSAPQYPADGSILPAGDFSLPPSGEPGKCYARVWEPATYGTATEKLLAKDATERIEIIPAQYEWVEENVLVRAAHEREEIVPASYKTMTESILVKPARTEWVKGRGLVEKVNNFTGEIMCLKEFPAEYKTITKQVLTSSPSTKKIQVPAEYKNVRVRKLVSPAQEKRIPIPAEYQTVMKTVLEKPGRMVWKSVICETNAPPSLQQEVNQLPEGITSINAQSSTSTSDESADDWFFLWKYKELFEDKTLIYAGEKKL